MRSTSPSRATISTGPGSTSGVSEGAATPIFLLNPGRETILQPGCTRVHCEIPSLPLPSGRFYLWGGIYKNWTNGPELVGWQPMAHFDVYGPELDAAPTAVVRPLTPAYRVQLGHRAGGLRPSRPHPLPARTGFLCARVIGSLSRCTVRVTVRRRP